jgi:hypothetical protein
MNKSLIAILSTVAAALFIIAFWRGGENITKLPPSSSVASENIRPTTSPKRTSEATVPLKVPEILSQPQLNLDQAYKNYMVIKSELEGRALLEALEGFCVSSVMELPLEDAMRFLSLLEVDANHSFVTGVLAERLSKESYPRSLDWLKSISVEKSRTNAVFHIFKGSEPIKLSKFLSENQEWFQNLSINEKNIVLSNALPKIATIDFTQMLKLGADPNFQLGKEVGKSIIKNSADADGMVSVLKAIPPGQIYQGAYGEIASRSPSLASKILKEYKVSNANAAEMATTLADTWAGSDIVAASAWLSDIQDTFLLQASLRGFIPHLLENDKEAADKWIKLVSDPQERAKFEDKLKK